jgi:predicted nucleotidyltransferase component of viral defense system
MNSVRPGVPRFRCYIRGMDLAQIRRAVIVAMFSDDVLMEQLVLKGGNALALIYRWGQRSSLDIDLSIEGDFVDLTDTRERIFNVLRKKFDSMNCIIFDERFEVRPATGVLPNGSKWGGYVTEFKLIEKYRHAELKGELDEIRRHSVITGPLQRRTFRIELSKHEFCEGKAEVELDDHSVYVYTPEMISIEKLRAICQQMPEYDKRGYKTARARDFYDIHTILTQGKVDLGLTANIKLTENIFAAKDVPLDFIPRIRESREFHRNDWPSVQAAVAGSLRSFDYYFDYVVHETLKLKSLWVEDSPK